MAKQHRDLEPVVEKFRQLRAAETGIADARGMLADPETSADPDLRQMAEEELNSLETRRSALEEEIKVLLLPKDPNDDKNIIIELRAGTGGDEAALFVAEMFRMYLRFAEQHRWKVEILSQSETGIGHGLKDVTAIIEGDKVYSQMKFESGVHRVQRVPATETRDACTRRQSPWPCFQRPRRSTSKSNLRTSESTLSAPRGRVASPSTQRTRRSGSRTFPQAPS